MTTGLVFDIQRFSLHDGPGIRTTVFLKGCPLRCWWCHNPESQSPGPEIALRGERCIRCGACVEVCPRGAITWDGQGPVTDRAVCDAGGGCANVCYADARQRVGREMSVDEVLAEVERDRPFYAASGGGATFSGGEPLLQADFLGALLRACRERGIHTALDTCGHAAWEVLDAVRADVNLFLYDLKLLDPDRHREFTGAGNELILDNLRQLSMRGHRIVVRWPVIPGINDDDENLAGLAAFVAALPAPPGVDILPFHQIGASKYNRLDRTYRLPETRGPGDEAITRVVGVLAGFGLSVRTGG